MKKRILSVLTAVMLLLLVILPGCYFTNPQKMKNLKGTYELTSYTRTAGNTNAVTDYLEKYGYVEYLIVTGTSTGYLVHKDNNTEAYAMEVRLAYEYDEEDSSLVAYVTYTINEDSQPRANKFGVTRDNLNVSIPAIKLSDKIYSDGYSRSFKKVSNDIDLSYAKSKLGELNQYDWESWKYKGIWELSVTGAYETGTGQSITDFTNPYWYYYVVIHGHNNEVTVYWADSFTTSSIAPEQKQKTVTLPDDFDWSTLEIDGRTWSLESFGQAYTCTETRGDVTYQLRLSRSYNVVDLNVLQEFIDNRIGVVQPEIE